MLFQEAKIFAKYTDFFQEGYTYICPKVQIMLEKLIEFNWEYLSSVYGSSHSSIIGFISYEWLKSNPTSNQVMDVPPGVMAEGNRRVHADLVLFESGVPKIIVEVETAKWEDKVKTIAHYLNSEKYSSAKGLLILTTVRSRFNNGEIAYNGKKSTGTLIELKDEITKSQKDISLVEILRYNDKEYLKKENKFQELRHEKMTGYYWQVKEIRFWSREIGELYRILFSKK